MERAGEGEREIGRSRLYTYQIVSWKNNFLKEGKREKKKKMRTQKEHLYNVHISPTVEHLL